ncbi:hypothetical protein DRJ25_03825 [Candidatus Woesearchaeota archaeon]|nr:MAG: hypothetical protein DRJ25_03825 [Candidatus Woesearchaeota archaeon]
MTKTKTKSGQHVNSIITTMASKCLSARQIKILEDTLRDKLYAFESDIYAIRQVKESQAGYFGSELAKAANNLSSKDAKKMLVEMSYSYSDESMGATLSMFVQNTLLKENIDDIKDTVAFKQAHIEKLEEAAIKESHDVFEALLLSINFMAWSENVPAIVCNSFDSDLAEIKKEAVEKMEAMVAGPLIINKPVPPKKPKATKRLKKTKKTKGVK